MLCGSLTLISAHFIIQKGSDDMEMKTLYYVRTDDVDTVSLNTGSFQYAKKCDTLLSISVCILASP